MLGNIGTTEIIIIATVFMVLFGSKQLPVFAKNLGESGKELKKASKELKESFGSELNN